MCQLRVRIGGNRLLGELIPKMQIPVPFYLIRFIDYLDRDRRERSAAQHCAICEALLDGDAEGAEALMRRHVRCTWDYIEAMPDVDAVWTFAPDLPAWCEPSGSSWTARRPVVG